MWIQVCNNFITYLNKLVFLPINMHKISRYFNKFNSSEVRLP
jgi:hypothetical protein